MVDGAASRDFTFRDNDTNQSVSVTLTWRDGIYFKLLEKIANALSRPK